MHAEGGGRVVPWDAWRHCCNESHAAGLSHVHAPREQPPDRVSSRVTGKARGLGLTARCAAQIALTAGDPCTAPSSHVGFSLIPFAALLSHPKISPPKTDGYDLIMDT